MGTLDTASDAALILGIDSGQQDALAETYRRHGAAVHNLARRVTGSAHLADEVTQEVFVGLWKRPGQFDADRGSLRSLLMTKTHSRAVDVVRSEEARSRRERRSAEDRASAGYDIDHYAWDLAIADRVKGSLETLRDEERLAIEMAYFDGMTYREVAEVLGEPEGTIKSRIRTGLQRLRGMLVRQGVDAP